MGITYDYDSNHIKDHVYEYLFRGSDTFKKVKKALDQADIIYDVTQDESRNSTKILEIDFDFD